MRYEIEYYCMSHIGKYRKKNQDNFLCVDNIMGYINDGTNGIIHGNVLHKLGAVFGVFDGMGGGEKGEVAAYIAAKNLLNGSRRVSGEKDLYEFCRSTNAEICKYMKEYSLSSMGTTAVILKLSKRKIWLCNIGDSKIFRLSKCGFQQISKDHVSVSAFGIKPRLLQYLGIPENELIIEPYITFSTYQDGNIYLICSDGLSDMVTTDDIERILINTSKADVAERLMKLALDNGGRDNITFIILYIKKKKWIS